METPLTPLLVPLIAVGRRGDTAVVETAALGEDVLAIATATAAARLAAAKTPCADVEPVESSLGGNDGTLREFKASAC